MHTKKDMESNIGVRIRKNRIFHNNKLFLLPLDHGVNLGYAPNLNVRRVTKEAVKGGADAIMIRPEMARSICDLDLGNVSLIMALTGKFDRRIDHLQFNSVNYAIECGADAVCTEFKFGSDGDLENSCISSMVSEEAHRRGLPHLVTVYVVDSQIKKMGIEAYAHACRIAEEIGADMIKTTLPLDEKIIRQCLETVDIPIIIAGGKKVGNQELLDNIRFYIKNGLSGVAIGRNAWNNQDLSIISQISKELLYPFL